jgi:hypothetical protein
MLTFDIKTGAKQAQQAFDEKEKSGGAKENING